MIIAVDFDGVLAAAGKWPGAGEPNKELMKWLADLRTAGNKVILWTCRAGEALETAVSLCREHGLEFDAINDNVPEIVEQFGHNSRKITADFYIDDKAVYAKYTGRKRNDE